MLNYLYGLFVCLLAMLTQGCNGRVYLGVESYDKLTEERVTVDKGWWERIAGSDKAQMSGSN